MTPKLRNAAITDEFTSDLEPALDAKMDRTSR